MAERSFKTMTVNGIDGIVIIDGIGMRCNLTNIMPAEIAFIQWANGKGQFEFKDRNTLEQDFDDITILNPFIKAYQDAKLEQGRLLEEYRANLLKSAQETRKTWPWIKDMRDKKINEVEWLFSRHNRELLLGFNLKADGKAKTSKSTSLSNSEILAVHTYVQKLADLTKIYPDPATVEWPTLDSSILVIKDIPEIVIPSVF